MKGKIEINKVCSLLVIIAYEARVKPMAKEPVLPTKIFPLKLNAAKIKYTVNGKIRRMLWDDVMISPIITIDGQIVSSPFKPPSWFTELVVTVTINGITMM